MQNLESIIESVRADYLNGYKDCLIQIWEDNFTDVEAQLLLEIGDTDELYKFYRIDVIAKENDEPRLFEFNLEEKPIVPLLLIEESDNFKIELSSFVWNGCEFWLNAPPQNWQEVLDWYLKWLDIEENNQAGENGFLGVVHSITKLDEIGNEYHFSVDFGSAPTQAFFELLEILKNSKSSFLRINSDSFS